MHIFSFLLQLDINKLIYIYTYINLNTYPNKFGYQKLLVVDLKKNKIIWETDLKYSTNFLLDKRCDLHPKWSEDGKKIVVDYAIKKRRIIRVYDYL